TPLVFTLADGGQITVHGIHGLDSKETAAALIQQAFDASPKFTATLDASNAALINLTTEQETDALNGAIGYQDNDDLPQNSVSRSGISGGANPQPEIPGTGGERDPVSDTDAFYDEVKDFDGARRFHFLTEKDPVTGMGYWENQNEVYPDTDDWDIVDAATGAVIGTLRGEKVRHHRFPDHQTDPFFEGTNTSTAMHVLGVR